nr:unnamed protein product [Callosobruchus chinensis]
MVSSVDLNGLSTELLIKIFSYVDIPDLCHLKQTCKRFDSVICSWSHIILKDVSPLVTNQRNNLFLSKCSFKLSTLEKIRISKNWTIGKYTETSSLFVRRKCMPWLQLEKKCIWLSRGCYVFCHQRNGSHIKRKTLASYCGESKADIAHFQKKGNTLVCGLRVLRDGSIYIRNIEQRTSRDSRLCHDSDINSVDINDSGNVIVSGGRDNYIKIWKRNIETNEITVTYENNFQDRIWKVVLSNEAPLLAIGTSANSNMNSIFINDIQRAKNVLQLSSSEYNHGVLDMKWDGPHCVWSCGYDTYLRKWDLRTGNCVQIYKDPHASALYCFDYDYCNTIMTGTQLHGRVILWDIRQKNSVQLYFMDSCKSRWPGRNSPIYSLAFDAEYLFTATDQNLNVLNFSGYDEGDSEGSDADDSDEFANKFSSKILSAPAEASLKVHGNDIISSSDDDESKIEKVVKKSKKTELLKEKWNEGDLMSPAKENINSASVREITLSRPVDLFERFWTSEFFEYIKNQTINYSRQVNPNSTFELSVNEVKVFFYSHDIWV